jgi:hypothetical protein
MQNTDWKALIDEFDNFVLVKESDLALFFSAVEVEIGGPRKESRKE